MREDDLVLLMMVTELVTINNLWINGSLTCGQAMKAVNKALDDAKTGAGL